jgi:hypothetical protein
MFASLENLKKTGFPLIVFCRTARVTGKKSEVPEQEAMVLDIGGKVRQTHHLCRQTRNSGLIQIL